MSNLRLLLILKKSALNRGMNTGLETLVWGLAEKGIRIYIVSGGGNPGKNNYSIPNNVHYFFTGIEGITKLNFQKAMEIIKKENVDIVIGRIDYLLPLTQLKEKPGKKSPLLIAAQGSVKTTKLYYYRKIELIRDLIKGKADLIDFKYRFFIRSHTHKIDKVIAISKAVKLNVEKFYKIRKNQCEIIYCGVDIEGFGFKQRGDEADRPRKYKILYAGNIQKAKGVEALIKAASKVNYPIEIIFCGNAKEKYLEHLRKFFSPQNKTSKINYKGALPQSELVAEYQNCDLFIFLSKSEGLGKALIEAMSCGCPVITSNIDTFKEIIVNEENGLMIPIDDPLKVTKAIEKFINDIELRKRCSFNARRTVEKKFSKESEIIPWVKMIESMISNI